nr:MAG TPA: hypothetical protein [Caudoviricetes sp.]
MPCVYACGVKFGGVFNNVRELFNGASMQPEGWGMR